MQTVLWKCDGIDFFIVYFIYYLYSYIDAIWDNGCSKPFLGGVSMFFACVHGYFTAWMVLRKINVSGMTLFIFQRFSCQNKPQNTVSVSVAL